MWNRQQLKMMGNLAFKRNYWSCVLVTFIVSLVAGLGSNSGVKSTTNEFQQYFQDGTLDPQFSVNATLITMILLITSVIIIVVNIFVANIFAIGGCKFYIENQTERPGVARVLYGFKSGCYGNLVLGMFQMYLFIFLWSLLLVVPGVIKAYEYLMVPYILAENPQMSFNEAKLISRDMMNGQKMEALILDLSFVGWYILSIFTCGLLAIFYVNPYREATFAELYTFNKNKAFSQGMIQ